jgi:hypothetical protein
MTATGETAAGAKAALLVAQPTQASAAAAAHTIPIILFIEKLLKKYF